MKYFLDSAKLDEIKYAYENYGIDGVTTNPKHIKLSGKPFMTCVKEIAQWLKDAGLEGKDFPVSFEINPHLDKADDIVAAAKEVASYSPNYCIKIPCCKEGLIAARRLEKEGVRTNVTLVFSPSQAIPAAKLGAKGVKNIAVYDASKTDVSELIAEIFRVSHVVIACPTYNGGIYPPIENLLAHMKALAVQNRTVAVMDNGTWAATAGKQIVKQLEEMKNMTVLDQKLSIKSTLKADQEDNLDAFAQQIIDAM